MSDDQSAPHTLEEKLAIRDAPRDNVARRSRKSILDGRFSRRLGMRGNRQILLNDTGMTKSYWVCTSDGDQNKPGTLYEQTTLTVREHAEWMMEADHAGDV